MPPDLLRGGQDFVIDIQDRSQRMPYPKTKYVDAIASDDVGQATPFCVCVAFPAGQRQM